MAINTIMNLRVYVGSSTSNCLAAYAAQSSYDDQLQTVTLSDGVVLYPNFPLVANNSYTLCSKNLTDDFGCVYVGTNAQQQPFFDVSRT